MTWKEDTFTQTFYQSFGHRCSFEVIHTAKKLKLPFTDLLERMKEYGGEDKKWAWLVKDVNSPRKTREARVIPKTSIECKSCKKQAVCMATIGDVEKYKCECGWWAELRDGVILKQGGG